MGIRLSFELSDRDLQFFREALKKSRNVVRGADDAEIIDAIDSAGLPEGEVLIDDGYFHRTIYPHEVGEQAMRASSASASVLPPLIESVAKE